MKVVCSVCSGLGLVDARNSSSPKSDFADTETVQHEQRILAARDLAKSEHVQGLVRDFAKRINLLYDEDSADNAHLAIFTTVVRSLYPQLAGRLNSPELAILWNSLQKKSDVSGNTLAYERGIRSPFDIPLFIAGVHTKADLYVTQDAADYDDEIRRMPAALQLATSSDNEVKGAASETQPRHQIDPRFLRIAGMLFLFATIGGCVLWLVYKVSESWRIAWSCSAFVAFLLFVASGKATACKGCGRWWARGLVKRELLAIEDDWRIETQTDSRGQRVENTVPVQVASWLSSFECCVCGKEWTEISSDATKKYR